MISENELKRILRTDTGYISKQKAQLLKRKAAVLRKIATAPTNLLHTELQNLSSEIAFWDRMKRKIKCNSF